MGNTNPVAQSFLLNETNTKKQNHSFSLNEKDTKNTLETINKENITFSSNDEKDTISERTQEYQFFSRFEKIAMNRTAIKAYKIFLEKGSSFAKEIETYLKISSATSYRIIEKLVELDLIYPLTKVKLRKTPGDKPTLYGLSNVTDEETLKASKRYLKSRKKDYKHVQEVYQITLNDVEDQQIQFKKICFNARRYGNRTYNFLDIAEQVADEMQTNGIKVWRGL